MKKLFILLVTFVAATMCYAQSTTMATLSHEGKITVFYGNNAWVDAHDAATDGDVITLSKGVFASTHITKNITLRGAGAVLDSIAVNDNTVIPGGFDIHVSTSDSAKLTIEGIKFEGTITIGRYNTDSLQNATFLKCKLYGIEQYNTGSNSRYIRDLKFIQCTIEKTLKLGSKSTAIFLNSSFPANVVIGVDTSYFPTITCYNCIIRGDNLYYVTNSEFRNCIFTGTPPYSDYGLPGSCSVYNSLAVSERVFSKILNRGNYVINQDLASIFKTYNGTYNDYETFELTDSAKTAFKGDDGKQIGIYGGNLSFDMTPTNPRITKFDVAGKTSSDGKLSVDIEVRSAQ